MEAFRERFECVTVWFVSLLFYLFNYYHIMAKKEENVFQRHDKDTGSPEMQIGILSDEIATLQAHVAANAKDYDAKRSLLKKVAKRRTFLRYLKGKDLDAYTKISKKIGLKV